MVPHIRVRARARARAKLKARTKSQGFFSFFKKMSSKI